jgi:hypothetical protein
VAEHREPRTLSIDQGKQELAEKLRAQMTLVLDLDHLKRSVLVLDFVANPECVHVGNSNASHYFCQEENEKIPSPVLARRGLLKSDFSVRKVCLGRSGHFCPKALGESTLIFLLRRNVVGVISQQFGHGLARPFAA